MSCSPKSLTGVCLPGVCLHSQQIIPFWYLHAPARKPDGARVIRIRVASLAARQKPPWYMSGRGKEVIVGNACRSEARRLPLMELPFALEENTGACLQLLWRPAWPLVMGWIWSSFKNVVPFFLLIIDFAYRQHTPLCFTLNSHGVC